MKVSDQLIQQSFTKIKPEENSIKDARDPKLLDSARQLEGLFISFVFKAMEKTIPGSGENGSSNNLGKMMFSSVMGKEIAENGGLGLTDFIYQALENNNSGALKRLPGGITDINLYDIKMNVEFGENDE